MPSLSGQRQFLGVMSKSVKFLYRGVFMKFGFRKVFVLLIFVFTFSLPSSSQETVGAITGTSRRPFGRGDAGRHRESRSNIATNLEVVAHTKSNGSYVIPNSPSGPTS